MKDASSLQELRDRFVVQLETSRRPLWSFLLRLIGDRSLAEEIYQETLLSAWRGYARYEECGRFRSWLFRIAHNLVRDEKRVRSMRPRLVQVEELVVAADEPTPEDQQLERERLARLSTALETLTLEQRETFLLRMHSGLRFRDIAELSGEPLSTVTNRMRDAVRKLSRAIEEISDAR